MNKLQQLEEQLSAIQAQIDEMKKVEEEWPKFGDEVWTMTFEGVVHKFEFTDSPMWRYKLSAGECHRTESEATDYRRWKTSPRTQARRMVEMCDGFDAYGLNAILVNLGELFVVDYEEDTPNGGLRFLSREQAKNAIDKLGEETIKLALGVE